MDSTDFKIKHKQFSHSPGMKGAPGKKYIYILRKNSVFVKISIFETLPKVVSIHTSIHTICF
jgi:hypothetical protein